jgi:hypothetical protein
MDIDALKAELLAAHPVTGPYDVDDAVAADQLNAVNRIRNKSSLTGSQVLNAIDKAEYNSKTADQKGLVWDILHLGELNPFGLEADLMADIFTGDSPTITALQALRVEECSRAVEIGLGEVKPGHVWEARR